MHPTTFSLVAADPVTGEIGIAVASKFLSVGAVVPFVRAGVGAIATQSFANTAYGPLGLDLLARGADAASAMRRLVDGDDSRESRQAGIVTASGDAATFTGDACIQFAGGATGANFAAQGNCLAGPAVVDALVTEVKRAHRSLSDRLVAALAAAEGAGGDKRGRQSAALIVEKPGGGYGGFNDRYVDLRVDDHPDPIGELARLLDLHKLYCFAPLPEDVREVDAAVGARIVADLQRIGALAPGHTTFDATAHAALVAFMHLENLENRIRTDGRIDVQTLDYLRAAPSSVHS